MTYYGYPFKCDTCGRFVRADGPGVSTSQSWSTGWGGEPDLHDPTYRCSACTDEHGVRPSNCHPPERYAWRNPMGILPGEQQGFTLDGFCNGPLFAPPRKRRAPKPRMQSTYRDRVVRSRIPRWADKLAILAVYLEADRATSRTGVQHSVDHCVPLNHPLVCGLHVAENLCVIPLAENIRKSNNHWPQMWGEQVELL